MIRTARLVLRPPRADDLEPLFALMRDPKVMRYWDTESHADRAQSRAVLDKLMAAHERLGTEFMLELNGKVIGRAGMWRMGEVGYMLSPDHWGRGLMQEALAAVIDEAFRRYPDLPAMTAEIDPRNIASARLLERLGFHETHRESRTVHVWGAWCDSAYYRKERPASRTETVKP